MSLTELILLFSLMVLALPVMKASMFLERLLNPELHLGDLQVTQASHTITVKQSYETGAKASVTQTLLCTYRGGI